MLLPSLAWPSTTRACRTWEKRVRGVREVTRGERESRKLPHLSESSPGAGAAQPRPQPSRSSSVLGAVSMSLSRAGGSAGPLVAKHRLLSATEVRPLSLSD